MTFVEEEIAPEPVVPQPPRKSPKEKRKKKKKLAMRESEGQFAIQLKTPGSAQPVEAMEEEGRPGSRAEILAAPTVQSAEDGAILAAEAASAQVEVSDRPLQSTNEVPPPIEGVEHIVEKVGAPTLGASEAAGPVEIKRAEERLVVEINDSLVDGNQVDTVPVSQPSSPTSTAATALTVGGVQENMQIQSARADTEEILLMLEQAIVKVCEWSQRIEAET
jgi:hypothetical protein